MVNNMNMLEKITWISSKRNISELTPHKHNPRIMTKNQDSDLRKSLDKFSLAEIPVVNVDGTIIAGHQRIRILKESSSDQVIDVRVPNRCLTDDEVSEYLLRSNKNTGEFDFDILANNFDEEMLLDVGFDLDSIIFDPPETDVDESDEQTQETKYLLEVQLHNELDQADLYDDLISKGFMVKKK